MSWIMSGITAASLGLQLSGNKTAGKVGMGLGALGGLGGATGMIGPGAGAGGGFGGLFGGGAKPVDAGVGMFSAGSPTGGAPFTVPPAIGGGGSSMGGAGGMNFDNVLQGLKGASALKGLVGGGGGGGAPPSAGAGGVPMSPMAGKAPEPIPRVTSVGPAISGSGGGAPDLATLLQMLQAGRR